MSQLENWLVSFIKSPQFPWIMLIIAGLILIEIVLRHNDEYCIKAASGVSTCFGMFCVYILTSVFFGPIHHSFLEKLELSSCLPFLSDSLTSSDWAVFSMFRFPLAKTELSYGILKLFLICLIYNCINDIIEKSLRGRGTRFIVWAGIQAALIFGYTIVLSSFNYIIARICHFVPVISRIIKFINDEAFIIFVFIAVIFAVAIFTKTILFMIAGEGSEDIPVLGLISRLLFENTAGASLIKAAVTTYFLILVFRLITVTYIKTFVFSSSAQLIFLALLMLAFIWYMIRQELYREGE